MPNIKSHYFQLEFKETNGLGDLVERIYTVFIVPNSKQKYDNRYPERVEDHVDNLESATLALIKFFDEWKDKTFMEECSIEYEYETGKNTVYDEYQRTDGKWEHTACMNGKGNFLNL